MGMGPTATTMPVGVFGCRPNFPWAGEGDAKKANEEEEQEEEEEENFK